MVLTATISDVLALALVGIILLGKYLWVVRGPGKGM